MIDLKSSSKVKELQAMLFPIHPIPTLSLTNANAEDLGMPEYREFVSERTAKNIGSTLTALPGPSQDLQIPQSDRIGIYSVPLKHREPKYALRALLDTRAVVDGITQEVARWPTECQVMLEKVRHIEYIPPMPEPFYIPTGKEPRPRPICDELGTVIFRYYPTSVTNYFTRSCVGGSTILPLSTETLPDTDPTPTSESKDANGFACKGNFLVVSEAPPTINTNTDLHFESRFESGNLSKVVKITDTYYQLHLRRDLYTQRHTQWFYFRISNTRSKTTYRFSIVNLCKDESLYNDGLRPLLYSTEEARTKAIGWQRCGDNISYYRNSDSCNEDEKEKHTLTFNVSFPHDHDIVYLAHCYPYTYTDLQEYLAKIVADPVKMRFTKLRLLCRTLAGNSVYYLTITAPTFEAETRKKKGVVITARVHPGETPSSWTMKGIIDFLTGDSNQARELRERFVFKLVPMLNPDGVIVGNNRCSLSGKDLNRQYRTVMRESYPTVWHTKLMIRRLLEECGIAIYCDLHAHSRKHNIFAYGCESKKSSYTRLSEQIFPLMLHKNAANKFSFENCKFHIEKGKEGTGRVVIWSMGVLNSYTIEASMGGSKMGSRCGTHFSTQDYEQIGKIFCETLLDFSDQDPMKEKLRNKIVTRLLKKGSSAEEPINIDLTDYSSDEGSTSNSSVSEDEITDYPDDSWDIKDDLCKRRRYPCVPPSSPTYFPTCYSARLIRRKKKSIETEGVYPGRRKNMARRAVMDLPTTDPGSDLCYLTDSADESFTRGKQMTIRGRHDQVDINQVEKEKQCGIVRNQECTNDSLILPAIVRPRSLSFGENVITRDDYHSSEERSHCLRLTRRCRDVTTSPSRDARFRLISLRQQIWMGVQYDNDRKVRDFDNSFLQSPLSCGISKFASSQCCVENEILLRSCSQKLQSLQYDRRRGSKKTKRKSRKKSLKDTDSWVPTEAEDLPHEDAQEKFTKKRRSRLKWQKVVNLNSGIKEMPSVQASVLTIKADSLKLLGVAAAIKPQSRQQKLDTRKKFRKGAVLATTITNISKSNIKKVQSFVEPLCKAATSGELPLDLNKSNITKAKVMTKKEKKTKNSGDKKRAASARILRNF